MLPVTATCTTKMLAVLTAFRTSNVWLIITTLFRLLCSDEP